ncbi:hypothetical protein CBM2606_A60072 [Cupriavidus taiwanensis]|nr:hypothetical protein CBM2606_A60072 [Cupriavidus taiwanensis]
MLHCATRCHIIFSSTDAGWSSWQLVGLITRRSQVQVLPPQPTAQILICDAVSGQTAQTNPPPAGFLFYAASRRRGSAAAACRPMVHHRSYGPPVPSAGVIHFRHSPGRPS